MKTLGWDSTLDRLHASDVRIAVVVSGGGSGAIARCFRRAGASRTFVEAAVPYSHAAMQDYLGHKPTGPSASVETARQLSEVAWDRCQRLSDVDDFRAAGIALVAALPTSMHRKGHDRIHVAVRCDGKTQTWSENLAGGEFTRESAESLADEMFLTALSSLHD